MYVVVWCQSLFESLLAYEFGIEFVWSESCLVKEVFALKVTSDMAYFLSKLFGAKM